MATSSNPFDSFLSSAVLAAENSVQPTTSGEISLAELKDEFWYHPGIDGTRWNKLYPYAFMVVKAVKQNDQPGHVQVPGWTFTLPIPPQSMSITTMTADKVEPRLKGFHQRVNGVTFEQITLRGTTGVLPLKGTSNLFAPNLAESIFAGTIEAAQRTADAGLSIANLVPTTQLVPENEFSNVSSLVNKTSGYYQFILLREFLRNYLTFSKTKKGADYRLAFASFKDQAVWLVSLQPWTVERSAEDPWSYNYNIPLVAFSRINLGVDAAAANDYKPVVQTDGVGFVMKAILDARDVLENARETLSKIPGDIDQNFFEPLRQLAMFSADQSSVPLTFAELPASVLKTAKSALIAWVGTKKSIEGTKDAFHDTTVDLSDTVDSIVDLAKSIGKGDTKGGDLRFLDNNFKQRFAVDKANDPFENPSKNYDLLRRIRPSDVDLPPKAIKQIADERAAVRQFTRKTFENMVAKFRQTLVDFECSVGAGGQTYLDMYGVTVANRTDKTPTDEDFDVIYQLNNLVIQTSKLAASRDVNRYKVTPIDYVAGLFRGSGLAFTTPVSKFAIPFPYGASLEDLAQKYLGDLDRWMEIAQLNGLRAPYVDEEGFSKPFLTDGSNYSITVANAENLVLGQTVWIQSNTKNSTHRKITSITEFVDHAIIVVDGEPDMADYRYLAGATLYAYLPDTVNSQQLIYIPSSQPLTEGSYATKDIPDVDEFDPMVISGGISLLLTAKNDLVITPDGGTKWAVGLTNIIQNTRIRLSIVRGTLKRHPLVGIPVKVGQSLVDLSVNELAKSIKDLFSDNPTYAAPKSVSVQAKGNAANISFELQVPGNKRIIPVTFETQIR